MAAKAVPWRGPCTWVCREVALALRGGQGQGHLGIGGLALAWSIPWLAHPFVHPPSLSAGEAQAGGSCSAASDARRPAGHPGAAGGPAGQQQPGALSGAHSLCFPRQLEQFNMMESAISSSSLYSPGSTLNYSQAAMMGLSSSHGSLQDAQQLGYASHSGIPNIILTGEAAASARRRLRLPVPRSLGGVSFPVPGGAWQLGEGSASRTRSWADSLPSVRRCGGLGQNPCIEQARRGQSPLPTP